MQLGLLSVGSIVEVMSEKNLNSLAVIVNFFDQNRVLIDGPLTGRKIDYVKKLKTTGKKINIEKDSNSENVLKSIKENNLEEKFINFGKEKKLNDFERFKLR